MQNYYKKLAGEERITWLCVFGLMMGWRSDFSKEETQNHAAWLLSRGEEKQSDIHLVGLGSLCEFRLAFIAGMINRLQYSICSGGESERSAELWSVCSRSVWEAFHYSVFNLMQIHAFFLSFLLSLCSFFFKCTYVKYI